MSRCRSCEAEIEWAFTENDKRIPLDVPARMGEGNLEVVSRRASEHGMTPIVRTVPAATGDRVSHFATCPEAEQHRRRP